MQIKTKTKIVSLGEMDTDKILYCMYKIIVCGDSSIADLFRRKYRSLYNSIESLDKEKSELSESIKSAIKVECDCHKANERFSHCHEINNFDISTAIAKLKSDKISDNGLV